MMDGPPCLTETVGVGVSLAVQYSAGLTRLLLLLLLDLDACVLLYGIAKGEKMEEIGFCDAGCLIVD